MTTPEQTEAEIERAAEAPVMPDDDLAAEMADELSEDDSDEEAMMETAADADAEDNGDSDDEGDAPVVDADPLRVLEAILFASSEPMTPNAMRERMPEGADVGGLLLKLRDEYAGRGVNLTEKDGTWAFRTAHDLADVMRIKREVSRKLSRSAMETLAIVAYHQPVTRAEIENIRGVATNKGTLDILMEVGWVRPGRRRETPGRPLTWVTTAQFMDQFGLQSLMDLPGVDELKASGLLDRRPAIETLGGTADLFGDNDSEDLKKAAADIAADEDGTDGDEAPFIPAEAAYDDEESDEEWEAAQADDTPIPLPGEPVAAASGEDDDDDYAGDGDSDDDYDDDFDDEDGDDESDGDDDDDDDFDDEDDED
jgi:segregation and condensation protein B